MEQLLCHWFGDFVLQPNLIGQDKKGNLGLSFVHSLLYVLPFLLLTHNGLALAVIGVTHGVIDFFRFGDSVPKLRGETSEHIPEWVRVAYDQGLHLLINYFALLL